MQRILAGECEKNDQRNASVITLAEPLFSLAIPGPPICLLFVLFKPFYSKNVHFGGIQTGIICG